MKCWIYRSRPKPGLYVYLAEPEGLGAMPAELRGYVGSLELAMELELSPGRKLAREDIERVRENLADHGFHIQLPPRDDVHDDPTSPA